MDNFIDKKIIIPMNKFAQKHPNMPLIISIIALLASFRSEIAAILSYIMN